jgi:uncharacterized protein (TIGR03000 family)
MSGPALLVALVLGQVPEPDVNAAVPTAPSCFGCAGGMNGYGYYRHRCSNCFYGYGWSCCGGFGGYYGQGWGTPTSFGGGPYFFGSNVAYSPWFNPYRYGFYGLPQGSPYYFGPNGTQGPGIRLPVVPPPPPGVRGSVPDDLGPVASEPVTKLYPPGSVINPYSYGLAVETGGRGHAREGEANGKTATVRLRLPAEAKLVVEGRRMATTGDDREFVTPPLGRGKFFYDVEAELVVDGRTVVERKRLVVEAGATLIESFPNLFAAANAKGAIVAGK